METGKSEEKPDATFTFVDADFMSVASGSMNPQMAFIRYSMATISSTLTDIRWCNQLVKQCRIVKRI